MGKARQQPKSASGGAVTYNMIPRGEVPKLVYPERCPWKEIIERCIATKQAAQVSKFGDRPPQRIMSSISTYVRRHPEVAQGYHIRTQVGPNGEVFIWVTDPTREARAAR